MLTKHFPIDVPWSLSNELWEFLLQNLGDTWTGTSFLVKYFMLKEKCLKSFS